MLASTILPLALVSAAASILPSVAASPVRISGQAPSVSGPDGTLSHDLAQRGFEQAIERSVAQLSARSPKNNEECDSKKARRSRKEKRSKSSVALYNQGDVGYFAPAKIGTPQQDVNLLLDTGSADILIPKATADFPASKGTFDATKSRTLRQGDGSETPFTFAQGTVQGTVVQDKVQIGGQVKIAQPFALFDPAFLGAPIGVLGLAFSSISKIGGPTFLDRLVRDQSLDSNLFSLYHSRGGASGSELTLGGVDSSRYTGELTTVPVKSATHWTIQMNYATVAGEKVVDGPVFSAVDSGSTFAIIPKAITDAYFARIPGSKAPSDFTKTAVISGTTVVGQQYLYPCDAELPKIGFNFDGSDRVFEISPEDAVIPNVFEEGQCISSFIGADVNYAGQKAALLGVPFLKSFYSVFNLDNFSVSFADAKH